MSSITNPVLDAQIPSSISRDSEVTAAVDTHAGVVAAHHALPTIEISFFAASATAI